MRRTLRQAGKNMSLIHFHTVEFLTKTLSVIVVHSACLNRTMYFRLGELRMTQRWGNESSRKRLASMLAGRMPGTMASSASQHAALRIPENQIHLSRKVNKTQLKWQFESLKISIANTVITPAQTRPASMEDKRNVSTAPQLYAALVIRVNCI